MFLFLFLLAAGPTLKHNLFAEVEIVSADSKENL